MLNHVSIAVRDIAKTKRFYDAVLAPLGYTCLSEGESSLGYGRGSVEFWISAAGSQTIPDTTPGLHFCFDAPTRDSVTAFHAAALQVGGRDNGKPGLRPDYSADYYAGFVVDPDGYRLEAYCSRKA